jgi:hypothetical protein
MPVHPDMTVDAVFEVAADIRGGSWVDASLGGIGGLGASLDTLSLVADPLGGLVAMGVGWLLEHVAVLREALDELAGNTAAVTAHSVTWENVAAAMSAARDQYQARLDADTARWLGASGDAYRRHAAEQIATVEGIGVAAGGVASAVMGTGMLVALVREIVRDLLADFVATLVARLPQWLAMEGLTLGIATPAVVSQVASMVAAWAGRIQHFIRGLLTSLRNLLPKLDDLIMLASGRSRSSPDPGGAGGAAGGSAHPPGPEPPEDRTDPRDVHGAFRSASRDVDPDHVWANGEMYIQDDGRIVKVLDKGNGTYDVVVRDMSKPSDTPNTVLEGVSEGYIQRKLDSGRWE